MWVKANMEIPSLRPFGIGPWLSVPSQHGFLYQDSPSFSTSLMDICRLQKIKKILGIGSLPWILRGRGAELGCWVAVGSSLQTGGTGIKLGVLQSGELWFPEIFSTPKCPLMPGEYWSSSIQRFLAYPPEAHPEIKLPSTR